LGYTLLYRSGGSWTEIAIIELVGRITEAGELVVELPADLPPGEVQITIRPISAEEIAAVNALWDEKFARSQDILEVMTRQATTEYEAGLTEDFDSDDDPERP
jgi:hypothetical protein